MFLHSLRQDDTISRLLGRFAFVCLLLDAALRPSFDAFRVSLSGPPARHDPSQTDRMCCGFFRDWSWSWALRDPGRNDGFESCCGPRPASYRSRGVRSGPEPAEPDRGSWIASNGPARRTAGLIYEGVLSDFFQASRQSVRPGVIIVQILPACTAALSEDCTDRFRGAEERITAVGRWSTTRDQSVPTHPQ